METDCLRTWDHGTGAEFRESERRFERVVGGEGRQYVSRRRGIRRPGIGRHSICDGGHLPLCGVGAITPGRRGKPAVLHCHVGQQLAEVPAVAGRLALQVFVANLVDEVNGRQHCDAVKCADILINKHMQTICVCLLSVNV